MEVRNGSVQWKCAMEVRNPTKRKQLTLMGFRRVLSIPLTLYAVTNSRLHPCLSENNLALIVSGKSMRFFVTVPVKEVL